MHVWDVIREEYASVFSDLRDYVVYYGGVWRMLLAPYAHAALLGTVVCYGIWHGRLWYETPLQVLPSLLGFTLAAYALLLGFGDDRFRSFLAERDPNEPGTQRGDPFSTNLLLRVSSIFLHFVVVQIVALTMAIVASSHPLAAWHLHVSWAGAARISFAFIGFFMFALSLSSSLLAALNIFHATKWYVRFKTVIAAPADKSGTR